MRKNAPASAEGSEAAGKARNLEKRAFSLPCISYNLHYTKYYKNQKQRHAAFERPYSSVDTGITLISIPACLYISHAKSYHEI